MGVEVYGCKVDRCVGAGAWVHGCMEVCWVYGCMDAWEHGCIPVHACVSGWVYGYMGVRVR